MLLRLISLLCRVSRMSQHFLDNLARDTVPQSTGSSPAGYEGYLIAHDGGVDHLVELYVLALD